MSLAVLLADGEPIDPFSGWMNPSSMAGQLTIVVAAVIFVGLIIFIWAAFIRKPQSRHSHHHPSDFEGGGLPTRRKRRSKLARMLGKKRRKRRRSRERPVNPTLAEIGGLPPHRNDRPPS
jgi:hypothetical protein